MSMNNPFSNDAFGAIALTMAINILPNRYGRLEEINLMPARPVRLRQIAIEERNGVLSLLPTAVVGAAGICWNGNAPHPTSPVGHVAIFYAHPWSDPWHHDHPWRDDQPVYDYTEYIDLDEDPDGATRNPTIKKPPYVSSAGADYTYGNFMHHDVTIRLSISACSWGDFGDMSLSMSSDFGYNMDIWNYSAWADRLSIPETELDTLPIIDGQFVDKTYNSAINLNWDVDSFTYMSVLHEEIHYNVTATLLKTRFDFSTMTFTPLPE